MYAYLIGALVVAALIGGAGWKGYGLGIDHERVANLAAAEEARKEEAERQTWNQLNARKEAKTLQAALAEQRSLNDDISRQLEDHLAEVPATPDGCPPMRLTDGLWDDWRRSNHTHGDASGRGVPGAAGTAAGPDGPKPSRDGAKSP